MRPINISRPLVLTLLAATAAVALLFLSQPLSPTEIPYSPDSWSYYELSRSVFSGDFYRVNTIRQFEFMTFQGTSFPPLWPVLIAAANQLAGLGPLAGYLLNFFIAVGLLFGLTALFRQRLGRAYWPLGMMVFALLMADRPFVEDLLSARTIPLAALLIVGLVAAWSNGGWRPTTRRDARLNETAGQASGARQIRKGQTKNQSGETSLDRGFSGIGQPLLTGLLAGLIVLTRFDFLLAGAAMAIVYLLERRPWRVRLTVAALHLLAFVLVLTPWVAYSLNHFARPFVSDNLPVVLAIEPIHVADFLPDGPRTLTDAPLEWLTAKLSWLPEFLARFTYQFLASLGPLILLALLAYWRVRKRTLKLNEVFDRKEWRFFRRLAPLLLVFAVQLASISLTGYGDLRYFSIAVFFLALWLIVPLGAMIRLAEPQRWLWLVGLGVGLTWLVRYPSSAPFLGLGLVILHWLGRQPLRPLLSFFSPAASKRLAQPRLAQPAWLLLLALSVTGVIGLAYGRLTIEPMPERLWTSPIASNRPLPEFEYRQMVDCLAKEPAPTVLVLNPEVIDAFRFGALTGIKTITKPRNLTDQELLGRLIATYRATHIIANGRSSLEMARPWNPQQLCGLPLYRIDRTD